MSWGSFVWRSLTRELALPDGIRCTADSLSIHHLDELGKASFLRELRDKLTRQPPGIPRRLPSPAHCRLMEFPRISPAKEQLRPTLGDGRAVQVAGGGRPQRDRRPPETNGYVRFGGYREAL